AVTLIRPWADGGLSPEIAVASAFERLTKVESVHVVEETYLTRLMGWMTVDWRRLGIDLSVVGDQEALLLAEERTVYDCEEEGTYQTCVIRDKATGEEVGRSEMTGGHRITEGDFVPPDAYHFFTTQKPDHPLKESSPEMYQDEGLIIGGRSYTRFSKSDKWTEVELNLPPGYQGQPKFFDDFWDLLYKPVEGAPTLDDKYDTVERLPDTELDGVMVERYRAQREFGGVASEVVELWIGKDDRFLRMATRTGADTSGSRWDYTYTFSKFNEPVDIPEPPD
ncbi:MAG: hypothetical protein ACE5JL_00955, partial [Dehalococcoidia bacterium]